MLTVRIVVMVMMMTVMMIGLCCDDARMGKMTDENK